MISWQTTVHDNGYSDNTIFTWSPNSTTQIMPIQLCRLYRFGMLERLWKSNTALRPTAENISAPAWIPACTSLTYSFVTFRNTRYARIAGRHSRSQSGMSSNINTVKSFYLMATQFRELATMNMFVDT